MSLRQQIKSNNIKEYYKNKSRIQKITKNKSDKYYPINLKLNQLQNVIFKEKQIFETHVYLEEYMII